jgi:uncharacterized protein YdiU (UPF0061 family)
MSYRNLPSPFYAELKAGAVPAPSIYALNNALALEHGFAPEWLHSGEGLRLLTGSETLDAKPPIAMAYAGHQFGHYTPLLGDGRAMLVGEFYDTNAVMHDLHLKGSGRTPFSRNGDGRATLGSVIREYVMSEAIAGLGVPTTRSLAIVTTGDTVLRDAPVPGAILARTARSHLRVGTFQYAATLGDIEHLKAIADFAVERLYPSITSEGPKRYIDLIRFVGQAQARLIAQWMSLGFIHGVMNTDNASIAGETIDYGPCAFMDTFDPLKVFSSIDHQGRYAWSRQAEIGQWNVTRFAEALLPLLGATESDQIEAAETALAEYPITFQAAFQTRLADKLGLDREHSGFADFIAETFAAMTRGGVDFTRFFAALTRSAAETSDAGILNVFNNSTVASTWLESWHALRAENSSELPESLKRMQQSNPVRIPRNHLVEAAIRDGEAGQPETMIKLMAALEKPYTENAEFAEFEDAPTEDEEVKETFCGT